MNELIRQFAEQAGMVKILDEHAHEYGNGTFENTPYPELEKFAELIVAECTAALFDESERLSGLYSDEDNWDSAEEYEIRSNQCIDNIALIEKHFGVEE
jgi:hypothetical protein